MAISSPLDIAKCICWIDPNHSTVTLEGGAGSRIASITDESGHNNDFSVFSGAGPTIAAAYLNSHDVMACGGFLIGPNLFSGLTEGEGIIFVKVATDNGDNGIWSFGSAGRVFYASSFDNKLYDNFGSNAEHSATVNPTPLLTDWNVYGVVSKANDWRQYLNGTQIFPTVTNTVGWASAPMIGRGPGGNNMTGHIAALYLFNAELTTQERADMYDYIVNKAFAVPLPDPPEDPVGGESGDTSELSDTSADTDNTFTAEAGAAIVGSFGYRASFGGTTAAAWGELVFTDQDDKTFTEKFRLGASFALPADGDKVTVFELLLADDTPVVQVQVRRNDAKTGGFEVAIVHGGQTDVDSGSIATGDVVAVKIRHKANAGAGKLEALVNGCVISNKTALSNVTDVIGKLRFGVTDPPDDPDDPPTDGDGDFDDVGVGDPATASDLTASPSTATVKVGKSQALSASVLDADGDPMPNESITWDVDDEDVATLSASSGASITATGEAKGTATVTATSGVFSADVELTILAAGSGRRRAAWLPVFRR